jgi:glutamate-5-semialdehyde dehydrogenase
MQQPVATLLELHAGQVVPFGGDRFTTVSSELAESFMAGDRLVVVQDTGALLRVPAAEHGLVSRAVGAAHAASAELAEVTDDQITAFFSGFAARLADDDAFGMIATANAEDVADAARRQRSTTRLTLSPAMRRDMIDGLHVWRDAAPARDATVDVVEHEGWVVTSRRAPLGVVGFVFEGRPNVIADATGVLRSGNTAVLRIGSDALRTARAIMSVAVCPALAEAGLPGHSVILLDTPSRAAGWALFGDQRIGLAVARGSGEAVAQLGAVARQSGVPVSLHGTGGAWMVASAAADAQHFARSVRHSLDRKVCNTLNVCCIVRSRADELVPIFLESLRAAAAARGTHGRVHIVESSADLVDAALFAEIVPVRRADGDALEPFATTLAVESLGTEWEWEGSPEVSLVLVDDLRAAVDLCNRYSPHLTASLISTDDDEHRWFYAACDAPFIGNGFTRWVDGQFALGRPELGLSNWENGRLFARSAVLSGDSVFTVRMTADVTDSDLHR